jgi:Pyruvate/2-oxoacid:ferredoxin oxidoreductase delta subunit
MGHITSKNYLDLQKRLDKHAQGAPMSDSLLKLLEELFTKDEADKLAKLPIKPFTAKIAAKRWKVSVKDSQKLLDQLAEKGVLLDFLKGDEQRYVIPPTMAGFFEFSLMRTDGKFNRKVLSELFYKYINEEEEFIFEALEQKTSIARTFIHEYTIPEESKSEVLDYERASKVIETATCITVGTCYCRHKMEHVGKACDMPQDVCLTFNTAAKSLSKHGVAKEISKEEAKKILDKCVDLGLVQVGDNVEEGVAWICNCCGCCCEALLAYKKIGYTSRLNSNFYAEIDQEKCVKCGLCVKKCPVDAIEEKDDKIVVNKEVCIGCGVCVRACPQKFITMHDRGDKAFVPKNGFERCVINAIERGKLQNYIFDNYELWTNEMLRHLLGIILKLSGSKFLIANKQLKSRFLKMLRKAAEKM